MVSKEVELVNSQGLHMTAAGIFVKNMVDYQSEVILVSEGKRINGKSVMSILASCIQCGEKVTVEVTGPDEEDAIKKAVELLESTFSN